MTAWRGAGQIGQKEEAAAIESTFAVTIARITTEQQQQLITRLAQLVAERAREEVQIHERHQTRLAAIFQRYEQQRNQLIAQFENRHATRIGDFRSERDSLLLKYETAGQKVLVEEDRFQQKERAQHTEAIEDARNLLQHRRDQIQASFKEAEVIPKVELGRFKQQADQVEVQITAIVNDAQAVVRRRCAWPEQFPPLPTVPENLPKHSYFERIAGSLSYAGSKSYELKQERVAKFLEDGWPFLIFLFSLVLFLAIVLGLWLWSIITGTALVASLAVAIILPIVLSIGTLQVLKPIARRHAERLTGEFQLAISEARSFVQAALRSAQAEAERQLRQLTERRDDNMEAAYAEWERTHEAEISRNRKVTQQASVEYRGKRTSIEEQHEGSLLTIEQQAPPEIDRLEEDFQRQLVELSESFRHDRTAELQSFAQQWQDLAARWKQGLAHFEQVLGEMNEYCDDRFPSWDKLIADEKFQATATTAQPGSDLAALRFGRYTFDPAALPGGVPNSEEFKLPPSACEFPAVISYPQVPSLLLEAEGDGRDAAASVLRNVMLRMLTSLPPGKVRFTVIDPVGLGQNFSAFMHLADYDERLVASRIWTESAHITQRLSDLTEHMEKVIQKYLRNEFASIQEYNLQAGEVAEPYQILVIANFPANFSEEAARRLVSIAASGSRCGVYTLISTDRRLKLPPNFDLADLEGMAATLVWDEATKTFRWKQPDLNPLPLLMEQPPDDEHLTQMIRTIGAQAKANARVEVPFGSALPPFADWWSRDSREEIEVPLGRAGAKKMQSMRLGRGTSQHVLIAGKTGSGKSTLLNALITNLAIHYSPNELQFYLIDFKKGVEFKAYAAQRLPHARVIAIESEREFGMSVLERLDQELRHRGDLFRKHTVQDLRGYRNANPTAVMPRILLVIDEFQEFFTSDDKISHNASLLLDRLVRQGRAFGIHVLLGSQTLAGAYSLARSTLGQMAVRIALQCSESDAHLILSEDNSAARLLNRPGEAIYNDANGLLEGNHPFQVVWLSDHEREGYLKQLHALAEERNVSAGSLTVFEGNEAADPRENRQLVELLQNPASAVAASGPRAWLGAAVAIKDPTDVAFRRQAGANLLVVGQQEELSLGVMANSVIALAAALPAQAPETRTPSFYILDGTRPDSPEAGFWERLVRQLDLSASVVNVRDSDVVIKKLAEEVERRMAAGDQISPPLFLVVYDLARFRKLKKSDDFSFNDDEGGGSIDKQFINLLREGPAVGVHTLIWSDNCTNVTRWLDRNTLRDLEYRVLFQMSASDSSHLMDSPAASKLGPHLALFHSEEQGMAEKFRPYGLPTSEWLAEVKRLRTS
ncbi:FtsK-like domain-containing protein [Anatilimnocola aggregata]|uniref:FtsK-like domain-containing protein n=1 Tax=Anatilimnocola aggregata TaxID=2528021 RepID=A0A517Y9E6_9BACT|nr:FtsK/SpoIIIE domain-containing protein [Anatilimnocola aggregata]QDU26850.1 FtsK-like domain-containing protein [Anatilimnocola aggregata]